MEKPDVKGHTDGTSGIKGTLTGKSDVKGHTEGDTCIVVT